MDRAKEVELFRQLANTRIKDWLEDERQKAYKYLAGASESVPLHRAQGRVALVEEMLEKLRP